LRSISIPKGGSGTVRHRHGQTSARAGIGTGRQVGRRGVLAAGSDEIEPAHCDIEMLAVVGSHRVGPLHGAPRGGERAEALIGERLAGLEARLRADDPVAANFVALPVGRNDDPVSRDEPRGGFTLVGDLDFVGEDPGAGHGVRSFGHERGLDGDFPATGLREGGLAGGGRADRGRGWCGREGHKWAKGIHRTAHHAANCRLDRAIEWSAPSNGDGERADALCDPHRPRGKVPGNAAVPRSHRPPLGHRIGPDRGGEVQDHSLRLKISGAKWDPENVEDIMNLLALCHRGQ